MILQGPDARRALHQKLDDLVGWRSESGDNAMPFAIVYDTIDDAAFPGAIIPRVEGSNLSFYAVADSGPSWRRLQPLLLAFSGVTLSDFDGRGAELSDGDPLERLLMEIGISHASRFVPNEGADNSRHLVESLVRLREAIGRAPLLMDEIPRTTAQLLGDFRLSLASRDRLRAEGHLESLRTEMRLDALNLYFLQVQLDAALGDWDLLRNREFFGSLCVTRRPPRVTAALSESLYHELIEPVETNESPTAALDRFRTDVSGKYGNLFESCPPAPSAAVAKMFLLDSIANLQADPRLSERLTAQAKQWTREDQDTFDRLLDLRPVAVPRPPKSGIAPTADPQGQIDQLKVRDTFSPTDARTALLAASMLQTLDAYRVAVDVVRRLGDVDREAVLASPGIRAMWDEVQSHAAPDQVPDGWAAFVRQLPMLSFAELRAWAEKGVAEYPIDRELRDLQSVQSFVEELQLAFGKAEETTQQILPYVVEWAHADDRWPNPEYRVLYQELLDLLLLGSGRTPTLVRAVGEILAALLAIGSGADGYRRTMGDLSDWLPTALGLPTADAIIDVVDLLATYPSPAADSRQSFWAAIAAELNRLWPRLSVAQQSVVRDLASVLDMPEAPSFRVPEHVPSPGKLPVGPGRGYVIAIYTLMEGAGQRVQRALAAAYPGVRVELSTAHVANSKLDELAGRADLFVVCWASAKHAATIAIRQRRPADRATIFPRGVGSSSVVREVQDYLAATVPT